LTIAVMTFFPAWSHIQEYLFFSLLALALVTAYAEGRSISFASPLHLPIACLVGWILLSVPFATDPTYSFSEWRKLLAKLLLFYWTVTVWRIATQDDARANRALLAAVALGSLALSLYAPLDFLSRGGTWADRPVRAQAPSSDYNWLSTYMVMTFPLLVAGALYARRAWTQLSYATIAALSLAAQALSYTRAGWLGMLAQGVAAGLWLKRSRLLLIVLVSAAVLMTTFSVVGAFGYHQDTLDPWTLQARMAVWGLMLQEIAHHPVLGVGYGTNTFMTRLGHHPETVKAGGSHNFFLMVAMGSGIPALVFLLWVLVTGITACLRFARTSQDDPLTSGLLFATALMMVGFAVRNGFDAMFAGSMACLFWLLLGAAVAQTPSREAPLTPLAPGQAGT
jgi:O-antigen ligase